MSEAYSIIQRTSKCLDRTTSAFTSLSNALCFSCKSVLFILSEDVAMNQSIDSIILEFAQQRPAWQQDLFRRAMTQPTITSADFCEVMALLRSEEGLDLPSELTPQPLSSDHVRFCEAAGPGTVISSISETKNVNRLASDQELPFASAGITLIYGDNGSGKSGYSRILKQLCRTRRDRPEKVLGDVYATGAQPPAQAKLTYSIGSEAQEPHVWVDGTPGPKAFSHLTVFDAQTAPIYVDKQNQIEFLPEGLDVLPRVGNALLRLAEMLEQEISLVSASIQQPVLAVPPGTQTAALLDRLNGRPLPATEEFEMAGRWSEEDDKALARVRDTLAALAEPIRAAVKCRRMAAALVRVAGVIAEASVKLAQPALSELERLQAEAHSAREAAKISASDAFKGDPFGQHVGSVAWRNLFRYAREFSEVVYPGEPFPVAGTDKKCVLCQQTLSDAASDRLIRFHTFLEQSASRDAEQLDRAFASKVQVIRLLSIPTAASLQSDLGEYAALGDVAQRVVDCTADFCGVLKECQDRFADGNHVDFQVSFTDLPGFDLQSLTDADRVLEAEANEYDCAGRNTSQRIVIERQQEDLEARKFLNAELPRVLDRLKLVEKLRKLEKCRLACDTTAISRKASVLRDEHITGKFQQRLTAEVEQLGLSYLPLKIATKSERGASFVGIALDQAAGVRTASVLSEGEFRVLALACFFAEVAGIPCHDGIIIDDPVSSLDHRHIRQVARRLVKEAGARPQVIIFTHNLSFYYELLEAAREAAVPVEAHWIQRTGVTTCGIVGANDAPWVAKKVKERIARLEDILGRVPKPETCSDIQYMGQVKEYYGLLRETWERLVEERLLNGVVGRFEPGVKTQSLKGVVVEDADYQRVFSAMAKASRYSGHDAAVAFQTSPPNPSEMRGDLDLIRKYSVELKKRSDQAEARRKALEEPITVKSA